MGLLSVKYSYNSKFLRISGMLQSQITHHILKTEITLTDTGQ